mmetsp:Transcript_8555/g.25709  ORF Transcript_8555/g.25709 Transcript_8555/m.25709 type:complete len:153 (-) Transcript_8555:287-745(-)
MSRRAPRSAGPGLKETRTVFVLVLLGHSDVQILDELEDRMVKGGVVVDYHSSDWFPERWFSVVVVPTCSNGVLHDRLAARGYSPEKITENVECEIMQVALDEARTGYAQAELLVHLHETPSDSDEIVEQVTNVYHRQWTRPTVGIQPTTHGD